MSLIEHAKREMAIAWPEQDEMQDLIKENILDLLKVFSEQGHSGMTAPYVVNLFEKLAMFKPINPLTGADDEWMEYADGMFQNIRDSEVFKGSKDGPAYWISGNIFRDQNGCTYTCDKSRVPVEFPWVRPESTVIDVYDIE